MGPERQSGSQQENSWQTQIRYFEKTLIKGLLKAVGRVTKPKRENVLVTDRHEGAKGWRGYKKPRGRNYVKRETKGPLKLWPTNLKGPQVEKAGNYTFWPQSSSTHGSLVLPTGGTQSEAKGQWSPTEELLPAFRHTECSERGREYVGRGMPPKKA